MKLFSNSILTAIFEFLVFTSTLKSDFKPSDPVIYKLGDSVFSFSDLDLAWPDYKYYDIFSQGQNKELKFVLQYY
jgi:hypothetical protein